MASFYFNEQESSEIKEYLLKGLERVFKKTRLNDSFQQALEDSRITGVDIIVCPECNYEYKFKEFRAEPCEHLLALMDDWYNV